MSDVFKNHCMISIKFHELGSIVSATPSYPWVFHIVGLILPCSLFLVGTNRTMLFQFIDALSNIFAMKVLVIFITFYLLAILAHHPVFFYLKNNMQQTFSNVITCILPNLDSLFLGLLLIVKLLMHSSTVL